MQNQKPLSWCFYRCAIEGAAALAALLLIPSEGGKLSPARLALIGILLASIVLWMYLGIRPPGGLQRFVRPASIISAALLGRTFGLLLFLLRYLNAKGRLPAAFLVRPSCAYSGLIEAAFSPFCPRVTS